MDYPNIGQIGLGSIGSIYAGHFLRAGVPLIVFDTDPAPVRQACEAGAVAASSLTDFAEKAEVFFLALPNPDIDREILLGDGGLIAQARPGALIIDLSTIDPDTAREFYRAAKSREIDYIEAPVSGGEPMCPGTEGAKAANLTFMVGGEEQAFERAKPLMKILGTRFFYLGPAGTGATVKLISNQITGLINLVLAEAFNLGAAAGIEPETLFQVFDGTDANNYWLFNHVAPRIAKQDFEPGFSVDLMFKDHRLSEDLARQFKVPMPFNSLAVQFYQMMRAGGRGKKDMLEAMRFMGQLAGTDIYSVRKTETQP